MLDYKGRAGWRPRLIMVLEQLGTGSDQREVMMKRLALILTMTVLSFSAFAAGIDSHIYTCADLHALIATRGFVFINNPDFEDFVVADVSYCPGGRYNGIIQLRSVATRDNPECLVNYCTPVRGNDTRQ